MTESEKEKRERERKEAEFNSLVCSPLEMKRKGERGNQ
jgi:hypothetical protein